MVGGGTEVRSRKSDRCFRISSKDSILEGLFSEESEDEGENLLGEDANEVGCCCLRRALTSLKWEEED